MIIIARFALFLSTYQPRPPAPDRLHKANASGGGPNGFVLPDGCVDGTFSWETPSPFVSCLNWVFSEGGFPWPSGDSRQQRIRHRLGEDLLPPDRAIRGK